ncbi:Crp/Fnr family transcriptional regulator [Rhizobium mongolense]|uniref:CRP/FNR family transcriptional regulator n=1 Tax=Rhizobium mongolense TaxID=57676 RepID=A0A7W6RV80_9HYPH|nr:cyclic nucleotide-binding domain-containing protein [Rhizobium mongolense]MBB4279269.1 CRP/FNR family transcriptional regulator [Rhizobium mongolense]
MLMQKNIAFEAIQGSVNDNSGQLSLKSLFNSIPQEGLQAGKALFWEGDPANHLFELVEGVMRLYRIIGDGRRVITAFLYPGDLVGTSLQKRYLYTAEAVTDCKIRRIARKNFYDEISRSACLRPDFISLLCQEMAAAHDQMVLLSKKNAEERLCSFLLQLISREMTNAAGDLVMLPMNRLDIADYLGLTIETVSRTISKLASRNILVPVGRHDMKILNLKRLIQLSGNGDDFSLENCHSGSIH